VFFRFILGKKISGDFWECVAWRVSELSALFAFTAAILRIPFRERRISYTVLIFQTLCRGKSDPSFLMRHFFRWAFRKSGNID
jgi:hypothetical protein